MTTIRTGKLNRIGIYGSSSGRNAGDAALIGGIMDGIDGVLERKLSYEIPTYRPEYIRNEYPNETVPVSMLPWHGAVGMLSAQTALSFRRCDLNLVYDNMMFDKKLWNPLFNYMPAVWMLYRFLKRPGQLLGMYNVGCGPVGTKQGRMMLKETADVCDFVTVRDQDSLELLREVGVRHDRILVTADAALTVAPAPQEKVAAILREAGIPVGQELCAINVNSYLGSWSGTGGSAITRAEFCKTYGAVVRALFEEIKVPIVFVCTQHSDVEITEEVRRAAGSGVTSFLLSNVRHNHAAMKGVLGAMSFLFAMRLHANILATSMTTPAVALSFQKKVSSYYQELGLPENVISFDSFSVDALLNHALRGWKRRHEIRAHLQRRIPELQARSLVTAALIGKLDQGAKIDVALSFAQQMLAQLAQAEAGNLSAVSVQQR